MRATLQRQLQPINYSSDLLSEEMIMKAIAVFPGKADSVHLAELPGPGVTDVPEGHGVLVKLLCVGVDGTDKEINAAEYGVAPPGYKFLVLGHESFGQVVEVGEKVTRFKPGDYVVATVRRPGGSIYDWIGSPDVTPTTATSSAPAARCTAFSPSSTSITRTTWSRFRKD
jgi:threonine dehydrogenase-like Zn-dependent dehydrogenase